MNSKRTKKLTASFVGVAAVVGAITFFNSPPNEAVAAEPGKSGLSFLKYTAEGKLVRPEPSMFRKWIYVGTPLTPNDMNDGEASFPEFHAVYMDPISFAAFEKTGEYPNGTVLGGMLGGGFLGHHLLAQESPAKVSNAEKPAAAFSPYVDAKGNISLPQDYRTAFLHLGTFSVASTKEKEAAELHNVYTRKEDWAAYKRDGKWPDGAIVVKDVYEASSADLTTGRSSWASKIKVWFVMVKDTTNRFPDNELWGDGWGWALFDGKDRTKQVSESYRSDCRTCHVPAKKTDWLYLDRLPSP